MSNNIEELAEGLKEIRKKGKSYFDMGIDAGIAGKTLETIVRYPDKKYSKNTVEKVTEYIRRELNKPEPLSIQDINFLRSQNKGLKEQNESLQEENRDLREKSIF